LYASLHRKDRPDVKISYQERTQHLKKMREEYKRIQQQMQKNPDARRPSVPFVDTILRLIRGSKLIFLVET
jgi:hypothetical protein